MLQLIINRVWPWKKACRRLPGVELFPRPRPRNNAPLHGDKRFERRHEGLGVRLLGQDKLAVVIGDLAAEAPENRIKIIQGIGGVDEQAIFQRLFLGQDLAADRPELLPSAGGRQVVPLQDILAIKEDVALDVGGHGHQLLARLAGDVGQGHGKGLRHRRHQLRPVKDLGAFQFIEPPGHPVPLHPGSIQEQHGRYLALGGESQHKGLIREQAFRHQDALKVPVEILVDGTLGLLGQEPDQFAGGGIEGVGDGPGRRHIRARPAPQQLQEQHGPDHPGEARHGSCRSKARHDHFSHPNTVSPVYRPPAPPVGAGISPGSGAPGTGGRPATPPLRAKTPSHKPRPRCPKDKRTGL